MGTHFLRSGSAYKKLTPIIVTAWLISCVSFPFFPRFHPRSSTGLRPKATERKTAALLFRQKRSALCAMPGSS